MSEMKVILFYKFVRIEDLEAFAEEHRVYCDRLGIVGKVIVACEGINGSLSGTVKQIEEYKDFIKSYEFLKDVWFKEERIVENVFTKISVLVKDEIVALNQSVEIGETVESIDPDKFKELAQDSKTVVLDIRNDYEFKVGHFKGAVGGEIKTFREFPKFIDEFKGDNINRKIVIYCTGGIRCEKAGALMKEKGFNHVYQLKGGIINYCQTFPETLWDGKCFVFDKRLVTDVEDKVGTIGACYCCGETSDLYKNCKYSLCNKLEVICNSCQIVLHGCCSENCREKFWEETKEKAREKIGIVLKA